MNKLYTGDCLRIIRTKIPSESINLIYLDPPFNSGRDYGEFNDIWSSMEAYIEFVKVRTIECRRVLKSSGSLYLHCDPTSSHYLKIMLDHVFGAQNYRNEIVWHYRRWTNVSKNFQKMHDVIFFYTKSDEYCFNKIFQPYGEKTVHRKMSVDGKTNLEEKRDLEKGVVVHDVWDIPYVHSQSKERLGYPTQKPEALLERIIRASSNAGDTVLDPFCGCGTCCAVAERLGREWVGIDNNKNAILLTRKRIKEIRRQKEVKMK